MSKQYIKIVLLGDGKLKVSLALLGRVGKTSILNRYINGKFSDKEEMTINSCYYEKEMEYNGEKFVFCLWDTAGQEKFNALTPIYYRDAKGAILVYDLSLPDSFLRVKKWIEELKAFNKATVLAIAGNKIDSANREDMANKDDVISYATQENAKVFYTSAKTGEGLDEIFNHVTKEIVMTNTKKQTEGTQKGKKIVISKNIQGKNEDPKSCC